MPYDPLPLKPEDTPADDPADELAEYFSSRAFKREVRRQVASHETLQRLRAARGDDLRGYFAEHAYGHAANLA